MLISLQDNDIKEFSSFVDINTNEKIKEGAKSLIFNFLSTQRPYGIFNIRGYNNMDDLKYHTILENRFSNNVLQSVNFIYISINKIEMNAVIFSSVDLEYLLISSESVELLKKKSDIKFITDIN